MTVRRRRQLFAICSLALALRLSALLPFPPEASPTSNYWIASTSLLQSETLATSSRWSTFLEPGYPLFLALTRLLTGDSPAAVILIQILVATSGCLLLFYLARLWSGSESVALWASFLLAVHPYAIRQSVSLIYLTLYVVLLIAALLCFERIRSPGNALLFAMAASMAICTRFSFGLILLGLLIIGLSRGRSRQMAVAGIAVAIFLAPLLIRNYRLDGSIGISRSGWILLKTAHPLADELIPEHDLDLLGPHLMQEFKLRGVDLQGLSDRQRDSIYYRRAIELVWEDPWRYGRQRLRNLAYLFSPRPIPYTVIGSDTRLQVNEDGPTVVGVWRRPMWHEWILGIANGLLMLAALAGLWKTRRASGQESAYLVMLLLALLFTLLWPATRLRATGDFILIYFAAAWLASLPRGRSFWESILEWRSPKDKQITA